MTKSTIISSLLAFMLVFGMVEHSSIVTARGFDWSTFISDSEVATSEVSDGNTESTTPKKGNGFVRALSAPFRALGRLFGGRKNGQQARRISQKEAAKFESVPLTRIRDARREPTSTAAAAPSPVSVLSFDLHLQNGRELLLAGNVNDAISELSTAASLNPKSGEVNKLLGIAYESKGLSDRALQYFELALRSDENNPEHLNNLGYLLYKNGDYERATKYLKRAAKLSPNNPRIWNNLGLAQCERGKFDDAFKSFGRAVGEFDGHLNVAAQLQKHGYGKEAIKHLEVARALRPNSTDVLTKLVSLYEVSGRLTDAENTRRSLVALKTFADANK